MKSAVDLRPELGGKSFDRPDGITIVEIDPETGQLATGLCPLQERLAMVTTQAPFSECYRHNVYFDLLTLRNHQRSRPQRSPRLNRIRTIGRSIRRENSLRCAIPGWILTRVEEKFW
jgi:hypothetical protein